VSAKPLVTKSALVTGGSRGIGRAIVERLARDGALVTFSYLRDDEAAADVVRSVKDAGGEAWSLRSDQADADDVRRHYDAAQTNGGGLDIVVNNAAIGLSGLLSETSDDDFDRVMATNVRGVFMSLREATQRLRDDGRIINVSTVNTVLHGPGIGLYAASKGAVEQLTAVAAYELGSRRITVNTVSPGATDTDMLRSLNSPDDLEEMARMSPLGRIGRPEEVADVVAFLVGPDGAWMTGQNLRAGGGIR
jgi:3-oxoacyl-[acyl-carrier protein] reductase